MRPVYRGDRPKDDSRRSKNHRGRLHRRDMFHHARADDDVDRIDRRRGNCHQRADQLPARRVNGQGGADQRQHECHDFHTRDLLVEHKRREEHHKEGIQVQQQCHQPGGGVVDGCEIHERLSHIPQRAHPDELTEHPPPWQGLAPRRQQNSHQNRRDREAQEEHGECVHARVVGVATEDGESPERGGGDGDEQDAGDSFHEIDYPWREISATITYTSYVVARWAQPDEAMTFEYCPVWFSHYRLTKTNFCTRTARTTRTLREKRKKSVGSAKSVYKKPETRTLRKP